MANSIDVQVIMQEIRDRIRKRTLSEDPLRTGTGSILGPELPKITPLEDSYEVLQSSQAVVGLLPPTPPTIRGRIGSLLVKTIQRALFWYTPQIQVFHTSVVQGYGQQVDAIKALSTVNQRLWQQVDDLSGNVVKLSNELERIIKRVEMHAVLRADFDQGLHSEIKAREDLALHVEAESALRAELQQGLHSEMRAREDLALRVEAESALRAELQQGLHSEMKAREDLALRVEQEHSRIGEIESSHRRVDLSLHHLRAEVTGQATRISVMLAEARKKISEASNDAQLVEFYDEDKYALDAFYLALEDRFRGTRTDIKERQQIYLPLLRNHNVGTQQMPILDLGCGRGEWLELLAESGLQAIGVDLNRLFVASCKELGLKVSEGDAIDHLRSLPAGTLGAVTGFHIIEHLPLHTLIALIDETVRVLKPGGIALFETPNPANVLVGSHNFYIDPTHRNPLPGITTQFMLEARGLCDVQIINLHPSSESLKVRDGGADITERFNEYFYGPQDYAVIGRRV